MEIHVYEMEYPIKVDYIKLLIRFTHVIEHIIRTRDLNAVLEARMTPSRKR